MTVTIKSSGVKLDLTPDTKLNIEMSSPVFENSNTMSLPLSLPLTSKNLRTLNFPDRMDFCDSGESEHRSYRAIPEIDVIVRHGIWQQFASMSVISCSMKAIEVVLYFHESCILAKMEDVSLPQMMAGRIYNGIRQEEGETLEHARERIRKSLNSHMRYPRVVDLRESGELESYAQWKAMWAHIATISTEHDEVEVAPVYTQDGWLNKLKISDELAGGTKDHELVATEDHKYITAFLRLDYVLHCLFEYFGYTLTIDFSSLPYEDVDMDKGSLFEYQWHSICILNNTMDALYPGCLYYSALVPDMSCKDFLLAVKAQFGCTFIRTQDGNYSMLFIKNKLKKPDIRSLHGFSGKSVSFSFDAEYVPGDAMENITPANIKPVYMQIAGYNSHTMHEDVYAMDIYPIIHVPTMEGVCQRTTTSKLNGEDSTKNTPCPLAFANYSTAYILWAKNWNDDNQTPPESEFTHKIFYPCLRKSCFEYYEYWDGQFGEQDFIELPFADTNERSAYYHFNNEYNTLASACDKISLLTMLNTIEVATFDFTKPYLIQGRLCWPYKLSFEFKNGSEQLVSMELIAPRKVIQDEDEQA